MFAEKKTFQEVQIALFSQKKKEVFTFEAMVSFNCSVINACFVFRQNRLDHDKLCD